MLVTEEVSQPDKSDAKSLEPSNIHPILMTEEVSHPDR